MTAHELFAALSPALATEILEYNYAHDKPVYRTALDAVAQARKVRRVFLERQPRTERNTTMTTTLARPALELAADSLIRNWLLKKQTALLSDFLNALKIPHENGVVQDLPAAVDDDGLRAAVESLLGKYAPEHVAVYLHAFHQMNAARWANLEAFLKNDPRLRLGDSPRRET